MSKPTVRYRGTALPFRDAALLSPVDHPNHIEGHAVSNSRDVRTSKVLVWDIATGRIETSNTVYLPEQETP